jgi:hypothetical protein
MGAHIRWMEHAPQQPHLQGSTMQHTARNRARSALQKPFVCPFHVHTHLLRYCGCPNPNATTVSSHSLGHDPQHAPESYCRTLTCAAAPALQHTPACSRPLGPPHQWPWGLQSRLVPLQPTHQSPLSACTGPSHGPLLLLVAAGRTARAAGGKKQGKLQSLVRRSLGLSRVTVWITRPDVAECAKPARCLAPLPGS